MQIALLNSTCVKALDSRTCFIRVPTYSTLNISFFICVSYEIAVYSINIGYLYRLHYNIEFQ